MARSDERDDQAGALDATVRGNAPAGPRRARERAEFDASVADALLPEVPEIKIGDRIGEYEIAEKIGEGGFGTVYRAVQQVINKDVAIKVLSLEFSARRDIVSRFISEARAANKVHHRCIVKVFSFGRLPDGRQYYIMDCLRGEPLNDYLASHGGRMTPAQALPILKEVADGLEAAHAADIVHRDLKLENVFVCEDGAIKVLDFGIAKLASDDVEHRTQTGAPMGTPHYMSPEQSRGRAVDNRTDVYAFGVMAYRIFTGQLPFTGDDFMDIALKQISEPPPAPSSVEATVDPVMDAAILWMLEKDPSARPASMTEAYMALENAATEGGTAQVLAATAHSRSATRAPSLAPTLAHDAPRRSRLALWLAGAVAMAAAGLAFALTRGDGPAAKPAVAQEPDPPAVTVPAPTAEPAAPPPAAPPETVEFVLELTPPDARVELDDALVQGTTLTLPRSETRHVLLITADDYKPLRYEFAATEGGPIALALERIEPAKTARKRKPRPRKPEPAPESAPIEPEPAKVEPPPAPTRGVRVDKL